MGVDKKERKQWEHVLANLVPYQIGRYGQLMEWSVDIDDPKDEHRHVNHLFGLHPGHTVSPVTTPELAKAAKVVLVHRGDGATGWSMGWKLNQWARLQDGNHAYTCLLYTSYSRLTPEEPSCVWSTGEEEEIVKYMSLLDNVLQSEENSFKLYEQKLLLLALTYRICSIYNRKLVNLSLIHILSLLLV